MGGGGFARLFCGLPDLRLARARPKANSVGTGGGLWEKMLLHFQLRREDFLARHHERSNVESTFSMIKAKFRDHVRSKTPVAMVNEVLCKIICHNICVLIQESHELGIDATNWKNATVTHPSG